MPITIDLSHDSLFASYIERGRLKGEREGLKKGVQEGRQEGLQEGLRKGLQKGRQDGIRQIVQLQLEKRFGRLPDPVVNRLAKLSDVKVQKLGLAIVDAKSLGELFGTHR